MINMINNHDHDKYITTPEFNTLATGFFDGRLPQANLVTKTYFDTKLNSLNHFEEDGTQSYLVFKLIYRYFTRSSNTNN